MPTTTLATASITTAATARLPFRKETAPAGEYIVEREHYSRTEYGTVVEEVHRAIVFVAQGGKKRSIFTIVEMDAATDMDRMYARTCKALRAVVA